MSALALPAYDRGKMDYYSEFVCCPECSARIEGADHRKEEHKEWCSEHPRAGYIWASGACSVVENAVKDAFLGSAYSYEEVRLLSVDTLKAPVVWRGNEEIGRRVTVEIFVSNEAIRESM